MLFSLGTGLENAQAYTSPRLHAHVYTAIFQYLVAFFKNCLTTGDKRVITHLSVGA